MTSPRRREIAAGVLYAMTCVATVGALWSLRNQVELDSLRRDLLDVVGQTVQPAHASLWLKAGSS